MSNVLEVNVSLINDGVKFSSQAPDKHEIITDYIPPLGDGRSYLPLEMFLISFATCAGGTIAPLLRSMGKTVRDIQINAKGFRREQHPSGFERIILEISLTSPDTDKEALQKTLKLAEEQYCPVWAMIKGNVKIEYDLSIVP